MNGMTEPTNLLGDNAAPDPAPMLAILTEQQRSVGRALLAPVFWPYSIWGVSSSRPPGRLRSRWWWCGGMRSAGPGNALPDLRDRAGLILYAARTLSTASATEPNEGKTSTTLPRSHRS